MDTLNDIISGLKWGDLDPVEAHDRVLALFGVSYSSPKIHIVDIDGDVIESLNIMSHAEKLRDAINQDPESIEHHYQVMIQDER